MNTANLKAFAPKVRRQLMEAVARKLEFVLEARTPDYLSTFAPQVASLRKLKGMHRTELIERVAYTWFNRLAALRYLDAKGWHPFRARVLTSASEGQSQPEILKLTRNGALPDELRRYTDPTRLSDLLDGRIPAANADPQGEVYRHLVLAACRFYNVLLPNLFESLDDETELLLPDDLLTEQSVAQSFRTEITDADCAEVEVLGWLYQFYISERKDQVMARKSAVPTEDIPAVTQLFTPHWIVRYLVENSLGCLWLLNRPGSRLREHMPYYIEGEPETDFLKITTPEEIKLVDPACGSGHMLTYAFDLLYLIYEEEGYAPIEIPALILRYNLYGLEICPRAAQLAELALVFKAREKSRRFFQPEHIVRPNIIELREVRFEENELGDYISALGLGDLFNQPLLKLLHQFEEAKNFGSLIQPCLDERAIADVRRAIKGKNLDGQLFLRETHLKVLRVLEQAEVLTQRYHCVLTNPPYMGDGQQNSLVKAFVKSNYLESKADLFACFIERCIGLALPGGYAALITRHGWMFISSFEKLRAKLLHEKQLSSLIHLGARAFDSISGEVVQAAAFVFANRQSPNARVAFRDLRQGRSEAEKEALFRLPETLHVSSASQFLTIPGAPLCYWLSPRAIVAFSQHPRLGDLATIRAGLQTGNNPRFLRLWHEVAWSTVGLGFATRNAAQASGKRWFPINKGGGFQKWYGNGDFLINWHNDGEELKRQKTDDLAAGRITANNSKCWNQEHYFKKGLSWSSVSTEAVSVRLNGFGFLFDTTGQTAFPEGHTKHETLLALLNSRIAEYYLNALSPTMHFNSGNFADLPAPSELNANQVLATNAESSVELTRADWDNFETSWDFRDQPLLRPGLKGATLEASWRNWEAQSTAAIRRMQELETENNRLFINAYGLEGELQPEVPEEQITLARANARKDMAAFLSYAVGCIMGRYSPDQPGLILADAGDTLREYLAKVKRPQDQLTFTPDEDGLIPVLDGEWFEDDIVARTREFLRVTFGETTLRENLRFIEEALGKDLRKYFLTDFYKDHLKTYKKRPIYWMVQSPRKGFNVLIYMHRYTRDTMNLVLNRYLREYEVKLRNRLPHLNQIQASATAVREKTEARKEAEKITKVLRECEEWERQTVLPMAQARIEIDLDDGVKTNYLKLGETLAPIAGLAAAEEA